MLLQLRGVERAAEDAERRGEHTLDKMSLNISSTVAPISSLVCVSLITQHPPPHTFNPLSCSSTHLPPKLTSDSVMVEF